MLKVTGTSADLVISNTEDTIKKHVEYLRSMGMVVNESKTEVMWIGQKDPPQPSLNVNGTVCSFVNSIKALGVHIDKDLTWDVQARHAINVYSVFRVLEEN